VTDPHQLQRFLDAQAADFDIALEELHAGAKQSHWMWYIFPQLTGLGTSQTAHFYAIDSLDEARAYLDHPILGPRLIACVAAIGQWAGSRPAEQILGPGDALKFRSCLTLFDQAEPGGPFARALDAFYGGEPDERTLALLNGGA
jgi:uncharacterized protein (DUF1810 family)